MQLASAYGMKVLGTAGSSEGEEAVKQAGASLVFNHRKDGYVQMILVGFTSYGCTNMNLFNNRVRGPYWRILARGSGFTGRAYKNDRRAIYSPIRSRAS